MPPKRASRAGSASKKTAATGKVAKRPSKRATTPSTEPVRRSTRLRASSAAPSDSVAETSVAGSYAGTPEPEVPTEMEMEEQAAAVATVEEEDDDEDGMRPELLELILAFPDKIHKLTKRKREDVYKQMRDEILRLRQAVAAMEKKAEAAVVVMPGPSTAPVTPRGPVMTSSAATATTPTLATGRRDLRFDISIARPAAEMAAAAAAAAAVAEKEREKIEEKRVVEARQQLQLVQASTVAAFSPAPASAPSSSFPASTSPQAPKTPPAAPVNTTNNAVSTPSPWGLRTLFGSVAKRAFGRSVSRSEQNSAGTPQQPSQQSLLSPEKNGMAEIPSPTSPTPAPTSLTTPGALVKTPTTTNRKSSRMDRSTQPHTPSASRVEESPSTAVRQRRRGSMPGQIRTPRANSSLSMSRPKPSRPVEPNADKRAQMLESAAEAKRLRDEQAAERKRIQEQASMLEEQKRAAEKAQQTLDEQDSASQQAGSKRKRVRIDDLKEIPARLPGQSSGTFSFREEFFEYDSDSDGDDYVEMDVDEAELLLNTRPAKKMRFEENVFQSSTPQKTSTPSTASPATPSTPHPSAKLQQQTAVEQQRLRNSQHKPKKPSGLRQVSSISPAAFATPQQISAATPAPAYYQTPAALTDITEITEPSDTPAAPYTPAVHASSRAFAPATPAAPATSMSDSQFSFAGGESLWTSMPHIFNKDMVDGALQEHDDQQQIQSAASRFAIACNDRLRREQSGELPVQVSAF